MFAMVMPLFAHAQAPLTLSGHTGDVLAATFSPDGATVLTGSADATAILWDAASGDVLQTFDGHTGPVNDVAFSSDGTQIVTASDDTTAKL